jgi:hypothetical protein
VARWLIAPRAATCSANDAGRTSAIEAGPMSSHRSLALDRAGSYRTRIVARPKNPLNPLHP